jgi:putative phage-type endonuclease
MSDDSTILALPDRATWLEARQRGIGSSDVPIILGVSPFKSPFALWAEKCGLVEPEAESEAMAWGRVLEGPIAERYVEETQRELAAPAPFTIRRSSKHPWMQATLDREVVRATQRICPAPLEIKTTGFWKAEEWAEEPPLRVQVQTQWQLLVTGWEWASVAVLIGGSRFLWTDLIRNEAFIEAMTDAAKEFWRRVELRDPPKPDASVKDLLARMYPQDKGTTIALPPAACDWDAQRQAALKEIDHWTKARDEAEANLRAAIGEASYGVLPDGGKYSWRTVQRKGYTVQPGTVRTLRRLG